MKTYLLIAFTALLFIGQAFKSTTPIPPYSNGNPSLESELSLFMKSLFDHTSKIKDRVKKGKKPNFDFDYARVLTARATFPDKVASPDFKKFAMDYLIAVDDMNKAAPADQLQKYRNVINSCLNCHKTICPGPIPRIKQLEL